MNGLWFSEDVAADVTVGALDTRALGNGLIDFCLRLLDSTSAHSHLKIVWCVAVRGEAPPPVQSSIRGSL